MKRLLLLFWMLLVCAALAIGACTGTTDTTTGSLSGDAGPLPTNYRQIVRDYVRQTFKDPYSIRDAEIAQPITNGPVLVPPLGPMTMVWVVCVRANAKNAFGAYTGLQQTAVVIHKHRAVNAWDEQHYSAHVCSASKYEPFPEIMTTS